MNTLLDILIDTALILAAIYVCIAFWRLAKVFYQLKIKGKRYRLILRVTENQESPAPESEPEPQKEYIMESDVLLALRLMDTIHYLVERADVDPEIAGRFAYAQTKKMAEFTDTVNYIRITSPQFGEHRLAVTCKLMRTHDRGRCKENPI